MWWIKIKKPIRKDKPRTKTYLDCFNALPPLGLYQLKRKNYMISFVLWLPEELYSLGFNWPLKATMTKHDKHSLI